MQKNKTNNVLKNYRSLSAFTLAEVLITLLITGVIATLVIPSLINDIQNAQLKTSWKKAYSDIMQAMNLIVIENNGSVYNEFPTDLAGSEKLKDAFKSKLRYVKECSGNASFGGTGNGASADGCWHVSGKWKYLNQNTVVGSTNNPGLVLSNGNLLYFHLDKSDCSQQVLGGNYTRCGAISIDINGFKEPNTVGKDIFIVNVLTNSITPLGTGGYRDPATTCIEGSTDSANNGEGCSLKYLYQ